MKIAVLHWSTSSVGGIATTLENYAAVAKRKGDTFHVFACDNQRTKKFTLFDTPKRVRGGDSFINIDGYAPHHFFNFHDTAEALKSYDVIMTSFLCPHPTKAYGEAPIFMKLLEELTQKFKKPLIGYIHDAYWDTYKEWGELVLPLCKKVMVCQKAYGEPLKKAGYKVQIAYPPFDPIPVKRAHPGGAMNRVVWLPQWKNIKGIHQFMRGVPELTKNFKVDLYNSGIEYYKLRLLPEWKKAVGTDHFNGSYSGQGKASYYGSRPLSEVAVALMEADFSVDFQGHKSKYAAYLNGSYNHTLAESMYYGAVPVVSANLLKSGIPGEFVLPIYNLDLYPSEIRHYYRHGQYPAKRAREYVLDNFSAEKQYEKIFRSR